jgi:small subunit ribosomal protein S16
MKRMGRRHRPFFRICAMDVRAPRDGKIIEELGVYDPMIRETDARAELNGPRVDYWLSVGAQPTEKVRVLIKKYGSNGTHLEEQRQARERLQIKPMAPPPVRIERRVAEPAGVASEPSESEAASGEETQEG